MGAQFGLKNLAEELGCSESTVKNMVPKLVAATAIMLVKRGRPPHDVYMWWPDRIQRYFAKIQEEKNNAK